MPWDRQTDRSRYIKKCPFGRGIIIGQAEARRIGHILRDTHQGPAQIRAGGEAWRTRLSCWSLGPTCSIGFLLVFRRNRSCKRTVLRQWHQTDRQTDRRTDGIRQSLVFGCRWRHARRVIGTIYSRAVTPARTRCKPSSGAFAANYHVATFGGIQITIQPIAVCRLTCTYFCRPLQSCAAQWRNGQCAGLELKSVAGSTLGRSSSR